MFSISIGNWYINWYNHHHVFRSCSSSASSVSIFDIFLFMSLVYKSRFVKNAKGIIFFNPLHKDLPLGHLREKSVNFHYKADTKAGELFTLNET